MASATAHDELKPRDVCIVGIARTPIGAFLGSLSSLSAVKLGSIAIESALRRANVDPTLVQEVYFGNVLSANLGQAPARQAALGAGIPNNVVCTTINKVCSSGMKATMIAAQSIQLGINDVVVSGGMESMSNAPKYLVDARKGSRFGNDTIIDGMLKDGLWDVYNDFGMGVCAELCANQHSIARDEQDTYAIQSNERGIAASKGGAFSWEITPVEVSAGRGKPSVLVDRDESLDKFDPIKLRKLRPSFKEDGGSVTAGNASSISDGAAALVLVSGAKAQELGLQVIAKIRGYADAAQAPELFTTAPSLAIPKAISIAGLEASQIDFYEINEAFSVVAVANQKLLDLPSEKLNVHGGAVSLGHPLGCSGARILVTLLGVLRHRNGKFGAAGVCNGGGGASALVLELIPMSNTACLQGQVRVQYTGLPGMAFARWFVHYIAPDEACKQYTSKCSTITTRVSRAFAIFLLVEVALVLRGILLVFAGLKQELSARCYEICVLMLKCNVHHITSMTINSSGQCPKSVHVVEMLRCLCSSAM